MRFEVTIENDEVSAKDTNGKIYPINGVVIVKENPDKKTFRDVFYSLEEEFIKHVLAKGTKHGAIELNGKVNIY